MRKLRLFPVIILIILLLCSCSDVSKVNFDYGNSELYSRSDMDSAINKIQSTFAGFEDCTLDSITYGDDKLAKDNLDYCNSLADEKTYDECIVFYSEFHTSIFSKNPVLAAGEKYTDYAWYLARTNSGEWDLLTWGY